MCVCVQRVITLLPNVAFLDASKAFDRVNRRKLLLKLESRGVPTYILRLLSNELIGQYICVRWGSTHSEFFPIGNRVKQGGILSPLLFNVYMDDLSLQLHRQPIGCSVGGTVVNHMLYADDIVLFAPSAKAPLHYTIRSCGACRLPCTWANRNV